MGWRRVVSREANMITVSYFVLCIGGIILLQVGAMLGWLIMGLCNAAAEAERQAEQVREAYAANHQ